MLSCLSASSKHAHQLCCDHVTVAFAMMGKYAQHCSGCRLPSLIPRLPFLPALPSPPPPPVLVPGRGLIGLQEVVDAAAPALSAAEEIYLQSLTELLRSQLGELSLPGQLDQIITPYFFPRLDSPRGL